MWRDLDFETEVSSTLIYNSQVMFQPDLTKPATAPWHMSSLHTVPITLTSLLLYMNQYNTGTEKRLPLQLDVILPFLSLQFQPLPRLAILVSNPHCC